VYLLIDRDSKIAHPGPIYKDVPNIHLIRDDFSKIIRDTPVEALWYSGLILESKFVLSHVSDIIRFALLYKWGGAYFDTGKYQMLNVEWCDGG
jgi:hypothetical protein